MFKEYFIYNLPTTALAAGTGTVFTDVIIQISTADFIFKRTVHHATSNIILKKIFDDGSGRFLFKGSEDLRAVSGIPISGLTPLGFTPYNWPHPYYAKKNTMMKFSLADNSGAPNTVDLSYHGDAIRPAPEDRLGKPVDYNDKRITVPIVYDSPSMACTAAVGNQNQQVVAIDSDSDFVCTKLSGVLTTGGGGAGLCYVSILDTDRNDYWQLNPTYISNLIGNGQFPNVLTSPRFVRANSRLLITLQNGEAFTNSLILYFHGYKRY